MKFWPEVHWSEGQFLRPHHLQAAFRSHETSRGAVLQAAQPFCWGFLSMDLAQEAIENNLIELRSCELVLRDGTFVKVPENCDVEPRDFKEAFEKSTGALNVYIGVPELQAVRANIAIPGEDLEGRTPRYSVDLSERYDENSGENPQPIEVRRFRGAIFFGEEDHTGFEVVRLGSIERSAAGPRLVRKISPPVLRLVAWDPLCSNLNSLWNDIRARCEQLGGDAAERGLTFATGSPGDTEQLVKLQVLNELTVRFGAMASLPQSHPYDLYCLLLDAVGKLTLWDELRRPRELPSYNHNDPGPIFAELFEYVRALVNALLPKDYVERPFEKKDDGWGVELDAEWLSPNYEMFLGIRTPMQTEEIVELFGTINFKLASPRDALQVYRRRLSGLVFKSAGTVPNLPKSSDMHYFRIARTPPYWDHCETERGIYIAMPPNDMPKLDSVGLSLFVSKLKG